MIHDELVTYEIAKLAKEKGFPLQKVVKQDGRAFFYELPQSHPDWANCDAWYLPTQSLLQRWLREMRMVQISITPEVYSDGTITYCYEVHKFEGYLCVYYEYGTNYLTYERALEDALKYALENLI